MEEWLREIVEQLCIGNILSESKIESGNRLALIIVDNGVEFALKFYASYNSVLPEKQLDGNEAFFLILEKLSGNKIEEKDAKDIKQYHKLRNDLYHRAKLTTVKKQIIENYVKLGKGLFKPLFDDEITDHYWNKVSNNLRKELAGKGVKEPVDYEKVEIDGSKLLKIKTLSEIKITDAVELIIHGFVMMYLVEPEMIDVKKSLMISGYSDITDEFLRATLFNLQKGNFIEKDKLKLKRKALEKLRKTFLF
jgi:hypothetical protein